MSDGCCQLVAVRALYSPPLTSTPEAVRIDTVSSGIVGVVNHSSKENCVREISKNVEAISLLSTTLPPQPPARRHRLQQRASRRRGVMLRASSIPRVSDNEKVGRTHQKKFMVNFFIFLTLVFVPKT